MGNGAAGLKVGDGAGLVVGPGADLTSAPLEQAATVVAKPTLPAN